MSKKALFLDRDGVINIDKTHVYKIDDFEFVDGIFDLCRKAKERDYIIIVVTNQGGIGRGYYTEKDFQILTKWMIEQFANRRIIINRVYHCPYHPEHGMGEYKKESFDRKPNPGMFLKARDDFDINMAESILIGDKETDIEAAQKAGVRITVMLKEQFVETKATYKLSSLSQAINII